HAQTGQCECCSRHGHVDEHDPPPPGVFGEDAAEDETEGGTSGVHGAPYPEGTDPGATLGEGRRQQCQRGRREGRSPDTLHRSCGDEVAGYRSEPAEQRGEAEHAQSYEESALVPVEIGRASSEEEQTAEEQCV